MSARVIYESTSAVFVVQKQSRQFREGWSQVWVSPDKAQAVAMAKLCESVDPTWMFRVEEVDESKPGEEATE